MKTTLNTTMLIQLLLILLLILYCFLIVQPFILLLVWAIILAVSLFPVYQRLAGRFSGRKRKWATVLFTLVIALVFFVPGYYLASATVRGTRVVVEQLQGDSLQIPRPDPKVAQWPLIGESLYQQWHEVAENTQQYAMDHKEMLLEGGKVLLGSVGGFIGSLLLFFVSFFIAIALMYNAEGGYRTAQLFLQKTMGSNAADILKMARDTIRGVVKGILLVGIIQAILALIGFEIAGVTPAGLWAFLVLVFAIVQLPVILVLVPPALIVFSTHGTTAGIIFAVFCIAVTLIDNILKPLLMGKGLQTPIIIILIGSIGGLLLHGIIGLFVGAVVLAVGHRLYLYWLVTGQSTESTHPESPPKAIKDTHP
jgi:predicted PurR-regulated permease PerM